MMGYLAGLDAEEFLSWAQGNIRERHLVVVKTRLAGGTLQQCGDEVGVSKERARQMLAMALRKFRARHEVAEAKRKRLEIIECAKERRDNALKEWRTATADNLPLGVRAASALRRIGTLGDFAAMKEAAVLRMPNVGRKTYLELRSLVQQLDG